MTGRPPPPSGSTASTPSPVLHHVTGTSASTAERAAALQRIPALPSSSSSIPPTPVASASTQPAASRPGAWTHAAAERTTSSTTTMMTSSTALNARAVLMREPLAPVSPSASASRAGAELPPSAASATTMTSLWQALDLPPPQAAASPHESKRVVLLGRPLCGKRTLCRRLCLAAEAQYPSNRGTDDGDSPGPGLRGAGGEGGCGGDVGAVRRSLYRPAPGEGDDNITGDLVEFAADWEARRAALPSFGRRGTGNHFKELPHGAGIVHDYVVQRIPAGGPANAVFRGGITKRTIEFFCCDTAGALSAALPTPQSLEEAVVLLVVDVSQPAHIREQLDRQLEVLQAHVASILRTFLPAQDEVRRLRMMEARQRHWLEEEQRMLSLREVLAGRTGEAFLGAANVNIADVNAKVLRVPLQSVCPVKSVIVCTKTDILERLSRLYESSVAVAAGEEVPEEVDGIVPPSLRNDLRQQRKPLLTLVAQLLRQHAVTTQSALVAVSSRVGTTAKDSAGEAALVHPFYRGVWAYLSERLDDVADTSTRAAALESDARVGAVEASHLCSANFFPTAFLPCGLDTPAVLLPAVASQTVTLPLSSARQGTPSASLELAGSAVTPAWESTIGLGESFKLHQHYLSQVAHAAALDRPL